MFPEFQTGVSLGTMNTLRMDVRADRFCRILKTSDLTQLIAGGHLQNSRWFVLGGGSNVLFTQDFEGLILKMEIKGIWVANQDHDTVLLDVNAGEDWPDLVAHAVAKGWGGIENLALIPGTAGAAPVQNIAAYGHNLSDTLVSVEAVDTKSGETRRFTLDECQLGYRTSVFKGVLKNRYIITAIRLRLTRKPQLNTSYRSRYESIEQELAVISRPPYGVGDVYQAIVNIRRRKLPDVEDVGSAGSIFKNPVVTRETLLRIRETCPGITFLPAGAALLRSYGRPKNRDSGAGENSGRLVDRGDGLGRQTGRPLRSLAHTAAEYRQLRRRHAYRLFGPI